MNHNFEIGRIRNLTEKVYKVFSIQAPIRYENSVLICFIIINYQLVIIKSFTVGDLISKLLMMEKQQEILISMRSFIIEHSTTFNSLPHWSGVVHFDAELNCFLIKSFNESIHCHKRQFNFLFSNFFPGPCLWHSFLEF